MKHEIFIRLSGDDEPQKFTEVLTDLAGWFQKLRKDEVKDKTFTRGKISVSIMVNTLN